MDDSKIYVQDNVPLAQAFKRTTHLGVVAHQDDLEILALHGILKGLEKPCFGGIVLGDGKGSPRGGRFKNLTDDQMAEVRFKEQIRASHLGNYSFVGQLKHPSSLIKSSKQRKPVEVEIAEILQNLNVQTIYTHAPTDRHDTHVATLICLLESLKTLPKNKRPKSVLGCEVWRDLDWAPETEIVSLDVSGHDGFAAQLLGCFESQLIDGKRYDLACLGRRRAHATFRSSSEIDSMQSVILGLEMAPYIDEPKEVLNYIHRLHSAFQKDTSDRLLRFL